MATTNQFQLNNQDWTEIAIGPGSFVVQRLISIGVRLYVGTTQPTALNNYITLGDLDDDTMSFSLGSGEKLFAKSTSDFPNKGHSSVSVVQTSSTGLSEIGLTNSQLRESPVPVSLSDLPLPTEASTSTLQASGNVLLSSINTNIGSLSDAAASSDTGAFSLISFIKRGLQNWTTLLGRIPSLINGRFPVQTEERSSASAAAIITSDSSLVSLPSATRGIYVGSSGNIVAIIGGNPVTFASVPAGTILPIQATRINSTGTTATQLVALF